MLCSIFCGFGTFILLMSISSAGQVRTLTFRGFGFTTLFTLGVCWGLLVMLSSRSCLGSLYFSLRHCGSLVFYLARMVGTLGSDTLAGADGDPHLPYKGRHKHKEIKAMEAKMSFVLGQDVYFDKVEMLCHRALIGRLEYHYLEKARWIEWDSKN